MIRYLTHIEVSPAIHVTRAVVSTRNGVAALTEPVPFTDLPIVGLAEMETSEEVQDSVVIHTLRLTATLPARADLPAGPIVFRLTSADGSRWLMGVAQRPYPVVTQKDARPRRTSDTTAVTFSATLTGPVPLMELKEA